MYYAISQSDINTQQDAIRLGSSAEHAKLVSKDWDSMKGLKVNYFHADGTDHEKFLIYLGMLKPLNYLICETALWGYIPGAIEIELSVAETLRKDTIIADGETIFEHPLFQYPVKNHRCIVPINGFYGHHNSKKGGRYVPFYAQRKDGSSLFAGGVYSSWIEPGTGAMNLTFAIVTTPQANDYILRLYNEPKVQEYPMPLILSDEDAKTWLYGESEDVKNLIKPTNEIELKAWPVRWLFGDRYLGNVKEVQQPYHYDFIDPELFS